jgi:hypothetical protein
MFHEVRDEHGKGKELRNTKDTLEDVGGERMHVHWQINTVSCMYISSRIISKSSRN